jgi:exodeoxyribonuclease V gamma subunit
MPLAIRVSGHLDQLAADLAASLARRPLPPGEREWIVVQSLSLRRWLQQRLAEAFGCAAGLEMPFPNGLISELEQRFGLASQADDPWHRDRLRWRIAALAESADGDLEPLRQYLDAGHVAARGGKRLQLADRLADLLDGYQLYRPDMLAAWEDGQPWDDLGDDEVLRGHERWQAALWRRLRQDIALAPRSTRLNGLCERLVRDGPPDGWLRRLSLLATGVLPPRVVDLLEALSAYVPVTVWLVSPLPQPWGDLVSLREAARHGETSVGHPLVASLGRQARDWFRAIGDRPAWADGWEWIGGGDDDAADSVLARLHGLMAETVDGPAVDLPDQDRSLQLHICHGERREAEVARDAILSAFAELPDLRPHEVMVLAPDLIRYAPLVEAVFAGGDPAIRLPLRVADRSVGESDPAAQALLAVLHLARSRATLGEICDLLELPAVRAGAGLGVERVNQARELLVRAGLRWGRDAEHRAVLLDVPIVEAHGTLSATLDRLLFGWAAGPDAMHGAWSAVAAEGSPDHELLGTLLGWLQRCAARIEDLQRPRTLAAWSAILRQLVEDLLDPMQVDATVVLNAVATLQADGAGIDGFAPGLAEIDAAMRTVLAEEARASDYVSGSITLAGLKPMRTIPARVVVLLGMSDTAWPRRSVAQPFDLLAARPQAGDRQIREDDRQLFLEAILAARERLVITWPGRASSGDAAHERPPSACLAELCDAVDAAYIWDGDGEAQRPSQRLTTVHPLQPFSAAYLTMAGHPAMPTFDAVGVALARRLALPATARPPEKPFLAADLPIAPASPWSMDLDELVRWWQDPVAAWCRSALGFVPGRERMAVADDEPLGLDGLERYQLIDDLVADRLGGGDVQSSLERCAADGRLPLGRLGDGERRRLADEAAELAAVLKTHAQLPPLGLTVSGPPDWRVDGVLDPPPAAGVLRAVHAGAAVTERSRLALAIRLLAWNAWQLAQGETPGTAELVARRERITLPAHGGDARERFAELMALTRSGHAAPLPFFPRTAWAMHERGGSDAELQAWFSRRQPWLAETRTPATALVWRGREALDVTAVALGRRVWSLLCPQTQPATTAAKAPRKARR